MDLINYLIKLRKEDCINDEIFIKLIKVATSNFVEAEINYIVENAMNKISDKFTKILLG